MLLADFHAWKTLLAAEKNEKAVLAALKRGEGLAVKRLEASALPAQNFELPKLALVAS